MTLADVLALQAKAMLEAELQTNLRSAMLQLGWRYFHDDSTLSAEAARLAASRRARGQRARGLGVDPGFLDTVGARAPRFFLAECKDAKGVLSPEQHAWALEAIPNPGVEVYVLRPADWLDGTVLAILMAHEPPMEIIGRILEREGLA